MVRTFYTLLYYLLSPLMCLRWFVKSLRPPQYREPFRERFGFVRFNHTFDIWIHAVSVGETSGAISLINRLLASQPELNILVTTTTPTGAKLLNESLGNKVSHCYSPCDLPGTIKRFISRVRPKLVVIMETELWPNWISHIASQNIPIILANARLSESSKQKYSWFAQTSKKMLNQLQHILAVNQADAERFAALGVEPQRLTVVGNLKFDAEFSTNGDSYFTPWGESQYIWVAASTHQGEDEIILQAHKALLQQVASAKLVLVPRHPERFQSVEKKIQEVGFTYAKRSQPANWSSDAQVLLGDTMGELLKAYQLADVAFIGGSLVDVGGHNAIEAAYFSKPIITGPFIKNFQYVFDELIEKQAAVVIKDASELTKQLIQWQQNPQERLAAGKRGKAFIERNQGALDTMVTIIESTLSS